MPQLTERNQLIYYLYLHTFRLSFKPSSVYESTFLLTFDEENFVLFFCMKN